MFGRSCQLSSVVASSSGGGLIAHSFAATAAPLLVKSKISSSRSLPKPTDSPQSLNTTPTVTGSPSMKQPDNDDTPFGGGQWSGSTWVGATRVVVGRILAPCRGGGTARDETSANITYWFVRLVKIAKRAAENLDKIVSKRRAANSDIVEVWSASGLTERDGRLADFSQGEVQDVSICKGTAKDYAEATRVIAKRALIKSKRKPQIADCS
ncbi:hypothetical protein BDZ88DRAFT_487478 [Geranomyces variabilis]|nr:hypothetical protein BDZ88DRAFT_487478 [Geranomyces variabilis]